VVVVIAHPPLAQGPAPAGALVDHLGYDYTAAPTELGTAGDGPNRCGGHDLNDVLSHELNVLLGGQDSFGTGHLQHTIPVGQGFTVGAGCSILTVLAGWPAG
jgi:hypothetical protein